MRFSVLSVLLSLSCAAIYACSASDSSIGNRTTNSGDGGSGGSSLVGVGGSSLADSGVPDVPPCPPEGCTDFPAEPQFDGVSADVAGQFDQPTGAGPCVIEPQDGSLYPNNWQRPRIRVQGTASAYKITFHAEKEINDLVVYTNKNPWALPKDLWTLLAAHVQDEPIEISVWPQGGGESKVTITVAPVDAGGAIVYWGSTTYKPGLTSSALYGFHPGDDGVTLTLNPGMVQGLILDDSPKPKRAMAPPDSTEAVPEGQVRCVGCHASTPDGHAVAIADHWPWNVKIASIDPDTAGQEPSWMTPMGSALAQMPWQGVTTFSAGDGFPTDPNKSGRRRYISSFGRRQVDAQCDPVNQPWSCQYIWNQCVGGACNMTNQDDLIWIDLQADGPAPTMPPDSDPSQFLAQLVAAQGTGWGIIARDGDTNGAVTPKWSHDGKTVAYTSTDRTLDGHVGPATVCDIYTVPFNDGNGGTATPVAGASDPTAAEYYPDYSADDKLIAFNRVANPGGQNLYYRTDGEIYVVPASGGTATRLVANDPPTCTGESSPGVLNTWPKWSPLAKTDSSGKTYYFLVFSSARQTWGNVDIYGGGQEPAAQLYIAAVVDDGQGHLTDYPAIYLWNQQNLVTPGATSDDPATVSDLKTSNVTPAWNDFVIPPQPPVILK